MCTPFDASGEQIGEGRDKAHIDELIEAGLHGLILCSGTSEYAYLRDEERQRLIEVGAAHVAGRVPTIAQTTALSTADCIGKARAAEDAGVSAVMVLPPFLEAPGEQGIMYGVLMAGANFVLSTAGYMEGAMAQSYAKYAVDIEQMELFYRLGRGPDFSGLDDAVEAIDEVEIGNHYLGSAHTLANFETAFSMPSLMDHNSYEQWSAEGGMDANARGIAKVRKMLSDYEEPRLDEAIEEALQDSIARREREIDG